MSGTKLHGSPPSGIGVRSSWRPRVHRVLDRGLLLTGEPAGRDDEQELPRLKDRVHASSIALLEETMAAWAAVPGNLYGMKTILNS